MVYFSSIWPTRHYIENHSKHVTWEEAVAIILSTKNPRKKGRKFEIESNGCYVLFEIRNKTAYVINAKRT